MDPKKEAFVQVLARNFGNITKSCRQFHISRQTYYEWLRNDEEFKATVEGEEFREQLLDMVEDGLAYLAAQHDKTALIFLAKTLGQKRGYIEAPRRHELTGADGKPIETANTTELVWKITTIEEVDEEGEADEDNGEAATAS